MAVNETLECIDQMNLAIKGKAETATTFATIGILTSFFTVLGNSAFLITLISVKRLHSPSNILLGALSITDFLVGLTVQPFFHSMQLTMLKTGEVERILYHCYKSSFSVLCICSGFMTTYISVDRLIAICYPYFYLRKVTCTKYLAIVIVTGTVAFIFESLSYVATSFRLVHNFVAVICIPSVIIAIAYSCLRIFRVILKQRRAIRAISVQNRGDAAELKAKRKEKKEAHVLAMIVAVLFVCFMPLAILTAIQMYGKNYCSTDWGHFTTNVAILFVTLNSCINPMIYCFKCTEIRRETKRLFSRKTEVTQIGTE